MELLEGEDLDERIGRGPLSLGELLALTPNAKDLQAIGDELGKKLEGIGKDLGLPPVPSGLALPPLPPLPSFPLVDPKASPSNPGQKKLAAPAPSG